MTHPFGESESNEAKEFVRKHGKSGLTKKQAMERLREVSDKEGTGWPRKIGRHRDGLND